MGNLEGKQNENFDNSDMKQYLGNITIKQENMLNDRILQETINIMKENIAKNYSVNNLQLGVDKELLKLFDLHQNSQNAGGEVIPLNKLQEYLVRAYSDNKLQRLLCYMQEGFKIKSTNRFGILNNEEDLYCYDLSEKIYYKVQNLGEFSTLLIITLFECLIISEKDAGYHLIAKEQDQVKMFEQINEYGKLHDQLSVMMKTDDEIAQNLVVNLIITLIQVNQEYQNYFGNNFDNFQGIIDIMFQKLMFFQNYLEGKEEDPYFVRILLNKEEMNINNQQQSQKKNQNRKSSKMSQNNYNSNNSNNNQIKEDTKIKQKPVDKFDKQALNQVIYDQDKHLFFINEDIMLKSMNLIIVYISVSYQNKKIFLTNTDYFSRLLETITKLYLIYPLEIKIVQNFLQMVITLVDQTQYQYPKLFQEILELLKQLDLKYYIQELKRKGFLVSELVNGYVQKNVEKDGIDYLELQKELIIIQKQITLIQISY